MISFDDVTKENIKEHNPNWPKILDQQPDTNKIYLHAKDPYEPKYQSILSHFNNTQMISTIFAKILKNTIQIRNVKY